MNAIRKSAVRFVGASAVVVLLASTSAFAAGPRSTRDQNGAYDRAAQSRVQSHGQSVQSQAQWGQRNANDRLANDQRTNGQQRMPNNQQRVIDQRTAPQRAVDSRGTWNAQRSAQNGSRTANFNNNATWGSGNQTRGQVDQSSRYRENQRVNLSGRVTSFNRERDGYRVQLDHNGSYWIPTSQFGNRVRDLRLGISIGLGGIFRGGAIGIDAVSWSDNASYGAGYGAAYGNQQGYVRGVVEQVDYRSGILTLRDDATGRVLDVDTARESGIDLNGVRRGDYVTISGQWLPDNVFAAYRIDSVNNG
jgi:hypothetical protein